MTHRCRVLTYICVHVHTHAYTPIDRQTDRDRQTLTIDNDFSTRPSEATSPLMITLIVWPHCLHSVGLIQVD